MSLKNRVNSFYRELIKYAKTKKKVTIAVLLVALLFIIIVAVLTFKSKPQNLMSNLKNDGFVIDANGTIYCQAYSEGQINGIYKIKGKNKQTISDDTPYYLNIDNNYLYYLNDYNTIIKLNTNGKERKEIIENVDKKEILVYNNYIYYFSKGYLYRAKLDGENKERICNKIIDNYQIVGNNVYFSYEENGKHIIAKTKTSGGSIEKIADDCGKAFWVNGNSIYYIYEYNNVDSFRIDYQLYRGKTNGKNKKKIADISGDVNSQTACFKDYYVYYSKKDSEGKAAIYKLKLNGKNETKIVDVNQDSTKINIYNNLIY